MSEKKPWPEEWCDPIPPSERLKLLKKLADDLEQHVRMQKIIDDIKRRCRVSNGE